ncbi:MAG TPA: hypothetical protein VGD14_09385 [bacterium]
MSNTGSGEIADLADRLKLPRWKVTRHAIRHGWIQKQKKEPIWSNRELEILERWEHITPERIQLRLKAAGFTRSACGIVLKRKRLRLLGNLLGQSAHSLAECFGVDVHFVMRAIKDGRLKAKKRGTARTEHQGGDIWFIKDHSIREYILENVNEIDLRKVDKYWFVDIVAGKAVK